MEKIIRNELAPGRVAIITEEPHYYGGEGGYELSIYFTDILVYCTRFSSVCDGLSRAESAANEFLQGRMPESLYPDAVRSYGAEEAFQRFRFDRS